jgi:hypothetical protein
VEAQEHKRAADFIWRSRAKRWAFAIVPAVGVIELVAHVAQTRGHIDDADWKGARKYIASQVEASDLVTVAPRWADPIGRMELGPGIATIEREARPDETRFPRAFEVSIRDDHDPTLEGWRRTAEERFGSITVSTLQNPAPAHVIEDLVSLVNPQRMQVARLEGDRAVDCAFAHGPPQSGSLGAGPAIPAEHFACPSGSFVAASVAADLSYRPHRCIYAPPSGRGVLRLLFSGVALGRTLHGHHGLYVEAERDGRGAPVTITFRAGNRVIGSVVHRDGEGWKPFEFDTSDLAATGGGRADLVADIESSGERRMYCFEADTR